MKVFTVPVDPPSFEDALVDGHYSMDKDNALTDAYMEECRTWLRDHGYRHKLTGEIVRFPIADGAATYMIADAERLIWLPLGDAWQIPDAHSRGLRISELAAQLAQARKMRELFAAKRGTAQ